MCTPIAAASFGINAASIAASYVGQSRMAKAQETYQQKQGTAALEAYRQNLAALGLKRQEDAASASDQLQQAQREAIQARSSAFTAAGEAGISGNSVDALMRDFTARELNFRSNTATNLKSRSGQIDREMLSVQAGAQSQVNQAKTPVAKPSLLGAGLQLGGSALDTYSKYLYIPPKSGIS